MDGRIIFSLGGVIVIIFLGVFYLAEADFEGFRTIATETEEKVQLQIKNNEYSKETLRIADNQKELLNAAQQLSSDFDEATKVAIGLREKRDALYQEFLADVQGARKHDVGTTIPEMTLATGQKLTGVKILSLDASGMSVTHSNGASRIPVKDFPSDLKEKYKMDMERDVALKLAEPKLRPPGQGKPVNLPKVVAAPAPVVVAPPPTQSPEAEAHAKELLQADEQKLVVLQSQATYYHQLVNQWQAQKDYYLQKASNLTGRSGASSGSGRIHSDPAQAVRAEEQAKEVDKSLAAVKSQASQADALLEAHKVRMNSRRSNN